jgi:glycosyltransferase involved in cell wall biosynthesis
MSKLRVLHVIGGGEFGGAEQHILNLVSSFPADEVDVAVVCFYDSLFASKLREAGIPVITLDQFGRFDLRLLRALRHAFQSFQPAIIHTHGVKANFFSRLAARGMKSPLVTTVHSSLPYQQTQLREADRRRLRTEWDIPQDAFLFGTVARFVPVKGLPILLDAFAQFVRGKENPPYLVLVGDGPERERLEAKVREHGLEALVRFAGFRQDIPACLHACDSFVHSSVYEGLGYTIIEAMASEVPVVASNVGGVKEFVFHEETGLVVQPADPNGLAQAMDRLWHSPELRDTMVVNALKKVESSFTIEQMTEKIVALYRKLLR